MTDRASRIEARFGASADLYAASEQAGGADLERIVEIAAPAGTEVLLDVATGPGHTARRLAPLVARVVACDLATGMIATARRALGAGAALLAVCEAERLPFAGEAFDLVTCRIAPHHFHDVGASARELARVLAPRGLGVIVDSLSPDDDEADGFLHGAEVLRDPTHVRSHRRADWIALYEGAGLRVEHSEAIRKRHPFEAWLDRALVSDEVRQELRSRFRSASSPVAAELEIEVTAGRVEAFTDAKLLLALRHR